MVGKLCFAVFQRMPHQRRLACTRLSINAEQTIVIWQIRAILPFLELQSIKQPVACVFDGSAYVLLTVVDLEEGEGPKAGCEVSDF
jgi:hypothetical protein